MKIAISLLTDFVSAGIYAIQLLDLSRYRKMIPLLIYSLERSLMVMTTENNVRELLELLDELFEELCQLVEVSPNGEREIRAKGYGALY